MKGDGRIFRRKWRGRELPTWHVAYWGPLPNGTWGEIRESTHTDDERKAGLILRDRLRRVANHRVGLERYSPPRQNRTTVGELLDELIRDYETRSVKSLRTARAHIAHLREAFGADHALTVTSSKIKRYIQRRLEDGAAKATIDHETEKLGRAFSLAVAEGRLSFKPKIPKLLKMHENARQGFVESADFWRHNAELPHQVLRDIAQFGYSTGMRKGEILALTWDGWDRETRVLRLHAKDAKTGRGRAITLGSWPGLDAILDRRLQERRLDCPYIFHKDGQRIRSFSEAWEKARERSGVRFFFHDLRRTAVRNMMRAGIDQATAMMISGHRTVAMFSRYNIITESDIAEALRKRGVYEDGLKSG